jgi:uncharacterized SAM-binding protein YcdF (DUF218 family)
MFSSRYIFETKRTRFYRYCINITIWTSALLFLYLLSGYFFVLFSQKEKSRSLEKFFRKSPDLIVVFTGQEGRIPYALRLAKEFGQSRIFITGVNTRNSVETLIRPLTLNGQVDTNQLDIDYLARNTFENVISTLRYLREKKDASQVLIISHDYHILRVKTIMRSLATTQDNELFQFYYTGVDTDFGNWRNIKILYREVFKFFRTYFFLFVWDYDSNEI